jgi:hypothetical protein
LVIRLSVRFIDDPAVTVKKHTCNQMRTAIRPRTGGSVRFEVSRINANGTVMTQLLHPERVHA